MINALSSYGEFLPRGTVSAVAVINSTKDYSALETNQDSSKKTIQISPISRQLADAANKAEKDGKLLSRSELSEKSGIFDKKLEQLASVPSLAKKYNNEVPNTKDPELLKRAKQATAFVNNTHLENPFKGMSREDLSNIVNDDSGAFTFNERFSAFRESSSQESAWRTKVVAAAQEEYNETGHLKNFFTSVLEHFVSLPGIEKSKYPIDYATDLKNKIDNNFYYLKGSSGKVENSTKIGNFLINKVLSPQDAIENKFSTK